MDFEYIKNHYKVPAEYGREVIVNGRKGVITEDEGNYIGVVFYDDKKRNSMPCHPTWEVEYLETFNNKPPKRSASAQRYQDYLHTESSLNFREWLGIR